MLVRVNENGATVEVRLFGELDHHAAKDVMKKLNASPCGRAVSCRLDMSGVEFMDSSGIAVVLGLYRMMDETGGQLAVSNVSSQHMRIFDAAGLRRIIRFE